jgi:cobyrinic acid a,c-diamide synthase
MTDRFEENSEGFGSVLVSSPQGRSGKTVVSIGLCHALTRRGLSVQPFKKGPDYIDPSWLTAASGRSCRNLDFFLMPEKELIRSFRQASHGADFSIIEGAMGLYDGVDSAERGTTAHLSRLLGVPILLVVNCSRMTGSIGAMVSGYQKFQPDLPIAGVILNYVSGNRHEEKLKAAVDQYCRLPVVGSLPKDLDLHIFERHLGLIPAGEAEETETLVERIGQRLEPHLDLDAILSIGRGISPHPHLLPRGERGKEGALPRGENVGARGGKTAKVKIGVLFDQVFNFYYPENLEALKAEGSELIFINSIKDRLPEIDGLYIGGGFPEFFLEDLEANQGLRQDIADAAESGLPVYAECAGLMYLCETIAFQNEKHEMVGVLPAEVEMCRRPQGHGYVIAEVSGDNPFFPVGLSLRGHEFHHSRLKISKGVQTAYRIKRGHGIDGGVDGIVHKNVLAAFTHIHASGTPGWAESFVSLAAREKKKRSPEAPQGKYLNDREEKDGERDIRWNTDRN